MQPFTSDDMVIEVLRLDRGIDCTIGKLLIAGEIICWTLEDIVRPEGAAKVYGQTAIPEGVYNVVLRTSPRLGIVVPWIEDVPDFTAIQIHPGNTAADTLGCILVGEERDRDAIRRSRAAFDKLMDQYLTPHWLQGRPIKIAVHNNLEPIDADLVVAGADRPRG